jgi:hypothetical protein
MPGMYPPITNSCPRFARHLTHAPVRFPASYKLSLRLPMTPSNCCCRTSGNFESREAAMGKSESAGEVDEPEVSRNIKV